MTGSKQLKKTAKEDTERGSAGWLGRWFYKKPKAKQPETMGLVVKENLEAFIFAVVLVVIVRHFSLTPFRIPSSSMEPTLLGNAVTNDRLFVNRFVYTFSEIERWDVVVFLYPLNQDKHFIKRLVGLPGESLSIADGDIYVNGRIARKPPRAQETLWVPVSEIEDQSALDDWEADAVTLEGRKLTINGKADDAAWLRYKGITNSYRRYGTQGLVNDKPNHELAVGDVRLRATLTKTPDEGIVLGEILSGEDRFVLSLLIGGKSRLTYHPEGDGDPVVSELDVSLKPGQSYEIAFWHVDRMVGVSVGEWQFTYDRDDPDPIDLDEVRQKTSEAEAAWGFKGKGGLTLTDVKLDRDVYYSNEGILERGFGDPPPRFQIPETRYFMLGDNSPNSSDSRLWTIRKVVITRKDGTTHAVVGELNQGSGRGPTRRVLSEDGQHLAFLDEFGVWQEVRPEDDYTETTYGHNGESGVLPKYQTVGRKQIIGRAFFIFWPVASPARVRFIR